MSADETPKAKNATIHDIRNQLSNISLALEQLRFEIPDQNEDCKYYLDTIFSSCKKINTILEAL